MELKVYDATIKGFRQLNTNNFNDDLIWGTVFFRREALLEMIKFYHICGYALIDKEDGCRYPVDIHNDKIVLFEGTYNCMPTPLKKELIKYNIQSLPNRIWSAFFFQWQFMCDSNAFINFGSFIMLCNRILGSPKKYARLVDLDIALFEPITYVELCNFTRDILKLSNVDINGYDYHKEIKYLIDSLVKGYHINFTDEEITAYFYQICKLIVERWE